MDRDKRVTLENLLQGLKLQALRVNAVGFPAAPLGQQLTTVRATLPPRNSLAWCRKRRIRPLHVAKHRETALLECAS